MKDAARRESWCELQNTQIIDVPNVHDGRKSNGQVRFSVKSNLIQRENCARTKTSFAYVKNDVSRHADVRTLLAHAPRSFGIGRRGEDDGTFEIFRAVVDERQKTFTCDLKSSWTTR